MDSKAIIAWIIVFVLSLFLCIAAGINNKGSAIHYNILAWFFLVIFGAIVYGGWYLALIISKSKSPLRYFRIVYITLAIFITILSIYPIFIKDVMSDQPIVALFRVRYLIIGLIIGLFLTGFNTGIYRYFEKKNKQKKTAWSIEFEVIAVITLILTLVFLVLYFQLVFIGFYQIDQGKNHFGKELWHAIITMTYGAHDSVKKLTIGPSLSELRKALWTPKQLPIDTTNKQSRTQKQLPISEDSSKDDTITDRQTFSMVSIKNIKGIHTISKIKEKIKDQRDPALIKELHLTLGFIRAFDYSRIIFAIVIILSMISLFSVKQSTVNVNDDDKSSSENIEVPLYYYPCAIGGSLVVMFFFLRGFSFYNRLKKPKKQQQNSSIINSGQNISV